MATDSRAATVIVGRVIPQFVAEHGNVEPVVKELFSDFHVDVHSERNAVFLELRGSVVPYQPAQVHVAGIAVLPIVDAAVGGYILDGVVADLLALRGREPQALSR